MLRAADESGRYHFFALGLLTYLFLLLKAGSSSDVRAPGLAASEGASPGLGVFNHLIMETLAYMFSSSTLWEPAIAGRTIACDSSIHHCVRGPTAGQPGGAATTTAAFTTVCTLLEFIRCPD